MLSSCVCFGHFDKILASALNALKTQCTLSPLTDTKHLLHEFVKKLFNNLFFTHTPTKTIDFLIHYTKLFISKELKIAEILYLKITHNGNGYSNLYFLI